MINIFHLYTIKSHLIVTNLIHKCQSEEIFAFSYQYIAFWMPFDCSKMWHLNFDWQHDLVMSVL